MKDIDDIYLPLGSENERIETISRNEFIRFFDAERFIVKDEFIDNGIDFRVEIVKNNSKLGFGFNFQLKAKILSVPNSDGSHSKSLETSNIEYLINNAQPAFYGFYVKNENKIYYEDLNKFVKSLNDKSSDWEDQQNHTLRFVRVLDKEAVDEIYQIALEHGKLMRELNYRLAIETVSNLTNNKIIINFDKTITDDSEIRRVVETIGLSLINDARWNDILYIHKKASGNVANSAKYNLVLGIASYYSGNVFEAISFFKAANKKIVDLDEELKNHLIYFDTVSKYAIGLISGEKYFSKINELENSEYIGLYIKLEQAKNNYILSLESEKEDSYEQLTDDLEKIIDDPKANSNIKLLAQCDLILFEGHKNNMDYVQQVALINAIEELTGPNVQMRRESASKLIKDKELWIRLVQRVTNQSIADNNSMAYYNATVNEIKVKYEFEVYSSIVNVEKDIPNAQPMPDKGGLYNQMNSKLKEAYSYYITIGHVENAITTLSIKYELDHYLKDFSSADLTLIELEELVNTVDSVDTKRKLEALKEEGATHERFLKFINDIFEKTKSKNEEVQNLVKEMEKMDKDEEGLGIMIENSPIIHLYPIGYFIFPNDCVNEVLSIIDVSEEASKRFVIMFDGDVIPIANIYNQSIDSEGIGRGDLAYKGVESWRNIYKIRKRFFERKFYRVHIDFSNPSSFS